MLTPRAPRDGEGGFTLVELLVVIVLVGVIGGMVTASIVTATRTTRQTEARTYALTDLQRGLQRVGRELRAGELLLDVGDNYAESIGARVVRGGDRISYRYYLATEDDGSVSLLEDVSRTNIASGVTTTQNGLFIADIANLETDTPLFTYYMKDPTTSELREVECVDVTPEVCRQRYATATQVELSLEKTLPEQEPIRVTTTVNIRNTQLG